MLFALSGQVDRAFALNVETRDLAGKHEFEMLKAYGSLVSAFVLSLKGELSASVSRMEAGFVRLAGTHAGTTVPVFHAVHARTLAALGRSDEAERHAAVVREELRSGSERYYWPECQRLLGDYLRLCRDSNAAAIESAYADALSIARRQQAKTWQLYAGLSLARLWAERGETRRAGDLLAPLRAELKQGADLPALKEADAMLGNLAHAMRG
jgi:predicted ATPase